MEAAVATHLIADHEGSGPFEGPLVHWLRAVCDLDSHDIAPCIQALGGHLFTSVRRHAMTQSMSPQL